MSKKKTERKKRQRETERYKSVYVGVRERRRPV